MEKYIIDEIDSLPRRKWQNVCANVDRRTMMETNGQGMVPLLETELEHGLEERWEAGEAPPSRQSSETETTQSTLTVLSKVADLRNQLSSFQKEMDRLSLDLRNISAMCLLTLLLLVLFTLLLILSI